jgi:hypothetical protein
MSSSNSNDRGGQHHRSQPSTSAAAQAQAQQYAHRFANAAAQAAQPLLGYLSGHAVAGAEITAAAATARAANPTSSEEPSAGRRGSLDEDARRKEMRNLDSIVLVRSIVSRALACLIDATRARILKRLIVHIAILCESSPCHHPITVHACPAHE